MTGDSGCFLSSSGCIARPGWSARAVDDRKPLTIHQALIHFSEWLALDAGPDRGDSRTHAELASEFVAYWERDTKHRRLPTGQDMPGQPLQLGSDR